MASQPKMLMPQIDDDTLVTLSEARKTLLPARSDGKHVARSTFWRWSVHGIEGVKLEVRFVGATPYTSKAMIDRFIDGVTARKLAKQRTEAEGPIVATDAELLAAGLL